jgi:acyl-CoA synthetase (AMP-forming)/AMP-acid ligase II/acyl carrier protein
MYTSGSTGKPKGVVIKQEGISRLIFNKRFDFLNEKSRLYQYAPIAFDAATFEIWGALLKGGQLIISSPGNKSFEALASEIQQHKVTILWLTAGLFHEAAEFHADLFEGLEYLLAGGDSLHPEAIQKVIQQYPNLTFINGYGPTESTTFAVVNTITHKDLNALNPQSIGSPIANTKAYILGKDTTYLSASGIAGELCLSGPGLALGYHNNPQLSSEKFIKNPFATEAHEYLYRTGDLAKWLPDGQIEFLGRIDQQVKIRGFRIEPGEIESTLNQSEDVLQSLVIAKTNSQGSKFLVAYLIVSSGFDLDKTRNYLKAQLPAYMVPTYFVVLDTFPLTSNGKVDKDALPEPEIQPQNKSNYVVPSSAIEIQLADIWKDLLNLEQVGIYDNFFELGGHSILATRLASEIKNEIGVAVELKTIFELTDIASLSKHIHIQQSNTLVDGEEYELIEL